MNSPHPRPHDSFARTDLTFADQPPPPASGMSFIVPSVETTVPETELPMASAPVSPNVKESPQKNSSSHASSRRSSIRSPKRDYREPELVVTIAPPPPARPPDPFPEAGDEENEPPADVETASQSSQESQSSRRSGRSVRRSLHPTGEENVLDDAASFRD